MQGIFKDTAAIRAALNEHGMVTGTVPVSLSWLMDHSFEDALDLMSDLLIGTVAGENIDYKVVGFEDNGQTLLIEASLDPSSAFDEDDYYTAHLAANLI